MAVSHNASSDNDLTAAQAVLKTELFIRRRVLLGGFYWVAPDAFGYS